MSESSNFEGSRSSGASNEDDFDESEDDELEEFVPIPYLFKLKDPLGNSLHLSTDRVQNARVICPPFYTLLDHAVAILWILYSQKNLEKLDTSGIHWALKFLEGAESSQGVQSHDIRVAIDHLQEALVSMTAEIDEEKDEKGFYSIPIDEISTLDQSDYTSFKEGIKNVGKTGTQIYFQKKEFPSLILAELLSKPEEMERLLNESLNNSGVDACPSGTGSERKRKNRKETTVGPLNNEEDEEVLFEDLIQWRNKQIEKAIVQLEEIKNLDEKLNEIRQRADTTATNDMKDLISTLKKTPKD